MNQLQLNLHKVPSSDQALQNGVAWVGPQRQNLEGKLVRIQNTDFVVGIANHLTANDIALNSQRRRQLDLQLNMALTVYILN